MDVSYYPGCTLHGTAHDYHESIVAVFRALRANVRELDDWNCCGASSAHVMNPEAAVELPARNLMIAAERGGPLLVPCAACYHRLKLSQAAYAAGRGSAFDAAKVTGVETLHINEMLVRAPFLQRIREGVKVCLTGLRAVPYYGCLTVRPPAAMKHPRPEDPREIDTILGILGADTVKWSYKTDCCGGNLAMTRPDVVRRLSGKLFEAALEAGGEIIVTDCPMCQANLDTREKEIEAETGTRYDLPVVYITELIAVAMGLGEARSWWRKHLVDPEPLLKAKGWAA
jgi:heterodisulfide reductase subunit B